MIVNHDKCDCKVWFIPVGGKNRCRPREGEEAELQNVMDMTDIYQKYGQVGG